MISSSGPPTSFEANVRRRFNESREVVANKNYTDGSRPCLFHCSSSILNIILICRVWDARIGVENATKVRMMSPMISRIEKRCIDKGMKMTDQRRVIARVLSDAVDHPNVEEVHRRAVEIDQRISIATVYRTVRLFEAENILKRHEFGTGRARYEEVDPEHHDHLIDIRSGEVIEFHNQEIEELQRQIALRYGYKLVGHRLELYGIPTMNSGEGSRFSSVRHLGGEDKDE